MATLADQQQQQEGDRLASLVEALTGKNLSTKGNYYREGDLHNALQKAIEKEDLETATFLISRLDVVDSRWDKQFYACVRNDLLEKHDGPLIQAFLARARQYSREVEPAWGKRYDYRRLTLNGAADAAAEQGELELVKKLIVLGADWKARDEDHGPLTSAIHGGQREVFDYLLGYFENPRALDQQVLETAVNEEDVYYLKALTKKYSFSRPQMKEALDLAAYNENMPAVEILHELADKKISRKDALRLAASKNREKALDFLLAKGKFKNSSLDQAAMSAMHGGHIKVLRRLLLLGGQPRKAGWISARTMDGRVREIRYIDLAQKIFSCAKEFNPVAALNDLCGGSGRPLKSDAFVKGKPFSEQNFVKVALWAAVPASLLGRDSDTNTTRRFRELIGEDVKRVEETTGLSWKKYAEALDQSMDGLTNFSDAVSEVAEACVFPLVLADYFERRNNRGKFARYQRHASLTALQRRSERMASRLVCKGKSTLDFPTLDRRWHLPGNQLPDDLRPYKLLGSWHRFFPGVVDLDQGYSIVSLGSPAELKAEGNSLHHCVGRGSYATGCQEGRGHMLSLRKNDKPVATINLGKASKSQEAIRSGDGQYWKATSFLGDWNEIPSNEERAAYKRFVALSRDRRERARINFTESHGVERRDGKPIMKPIEEYERTIGFELECYDEVIPTLLKHYEERVHVPKKRGDPIPLLSRKAFKEAWKKQKLDFL